MNGKCEVNMESQTYAVVDLETTGHSSKQGDRIIQIAIVFMKDWQVVDTYTTFVNPEQKIPLFIEDLTDISNADVAQSKTFQQIAYDVYEKLQGTIFVAHNIDFDLPFLQSEFARCGLPKWQGKSMDTVELAKILFPTSYSYKLQDLALELGILHTKAHRADDDALATAYLLKACYDKMMRLPLNVLEHLHKRSFKAKTDMSALIFDVIKQKRQMTTQQEGYRTYRGITLKQQTPYVAKPKKKCNYPQSLEAKTALFEAQFEQFDIREGQFRMMDSVWKSLNDRQEVLMEASTGIGKTLAYLIPAMIYAARHDGKVAISTYTSYLQEQLLLEELPKAEAVLGMEANIAVLKGMKHYIDLDRFSDMAADYDDSYDENFAKMQFITWLAETETGDLAELNLTGGGHLFLEKVRRSDTTKDTRRKGAFDFYLAAMDRCKEADIIVTNHAMVVADLQRVEPILDNIEGWIIDEAHQMVQAAMVREETVFTYRDWKYVFGQFGSMSQKSLEHEWFERMLQDHRTPMRQLQAIQQHYRDMLVSFERAVKQMTRYLNVPTGVTRSMKYTFSWEEVALEQPFIRQVSQHIERFLTAAAQLTTSYLKQMDELAPSIRAKLDDWQYWLDCLSVKQTEWHTLFGRQKRSETVWLELDARSLPGSIQIVKKPISIKRTVMNVFDQFRGKMGIVWASGTLTAPENTRFIANQLGVDPAVPLYQFQAPASYYEGANVYIVDDMPDIKGVPQMIYIEHVAQAIVETVLATNGRCFVLFTSQEMLKKTVLLIQETEQLEHFMLFAQGVSSGSRMKLLKMFQKFEHSVLFGTNSFWEGVDVPGDALSAVIVVRLPFTSPDEPVFKAKADALQARGVNSFYKLSLPEAIIRFKQGFGRLIRSSHDKGAFIILDRRIDTKSYGHQFLEALPNVPVEKVPLEDMVLQLEHWYNN